MAAFELTLYGRIWVTTEAGLRAAAILSAVESCRGSGSLSTTT